MCAFVTGGNGSRVNGSGVEEREDVEISEATMFAFSALIASKTTNRGRAVSE